MARSTCSTGTTATSAGRTCCTRRRDGSSGSRRSSRSRPAWDGPLCRSRQDDRRAARRAADEPQRLARAAGPRHPAGPRREAHAEARRRTSSCVRMFRTDANPDIAPARDVGAARDRRLDARRARAGARRSRRAHPRLGGPAALRRSIAVARSRSRSSRGWRANDRSPVVRLYLASALQRMDRADALDDRRRADDARRGCRRSQPAEDDLARRGAAGQGEPGARARPRVARAASRWSPGSSRAGRSMPMRSSRSSPRLASDPKTRSACSRACGTASRGGST